MSLVECNSGPVALHVIEHAESFAATDLQLQPTQALRILPERREVYAGSVLADGCAVVAKRFLPHPKQARDWKREWRGLLKLQELGLSAPMPLCVAEEGEGAAIWVVMERIDGVQPLLATYEAAGEDERIELSRQLAQLVDAAHRAGVRQADQHVDNWAWDGARLYLLDAGSIEFSGHALKGAARLQDLAGICVTLSPLAESGFRSALKTVYLKDDTETREQLFYELEAAIVALQHERTRRYYKKTRRSCTEFVRTETPDFRMLALRAADASLVDALKTDPEALMERGERLKAGNTCTVQGFSHQGKDYVLKRYNQKSLMHRMRHAFADSRALKSWSSSWVLDMAFIPTARAVAVYEDVRERLPGLRYLLMERIAGQLLPDYVQRCAGDAERIDAVATEFAQLWSALGRLRAAHGDLKATNLIVGDDGRLYLFDLDAFRFGLNAKAFEAGRAKDLKRFMQNWCEDAELTQLFESKVRDFSE